MTDTELVAQFRNLLKQMGDESVCKGCRRKIYWLVTKNGKRAPITEDGLNHFADCPDAPHFRGPK